MSFFRVICVFFSAQSVFLLAVFASSLKEWRLFCPFSTLSVSFFFSALSVSFFLRYLCPFFSILWVSSALYVMSPKGDVGFGEP